MGKELIKARIDAGLKAKDVSKECGISNTYYSKLENNKASNPSRDLMLKISKVLNKPVEKLFFSEN
ncbi:helix-turn-helix transcriptional regulator [Clostridium beijerinckii]|uniref:helix-turn-helix transcriptional regulator n=1 Tax=Clostridium beijerinckii TaxID=1520 RepID=UPI0002E5EEE4|nr:helix-turn-helix transcriptional regulator [Clostridium beijerinckii]